MAEEESNWQESDRVFITLLKMVSQKPLIWTMMKPLKENCFQLRNPLGPDCQNTISIIIVSMQIPDFLKHKGHINV